MNGRSSAFDCGIPQKSLEKIIKNQILSKLPDCGKAGLCNAPKNRTAARRFRGQDNIIRGETIYDQSWRMIRYQRLN
jgi:hypothetical protein